MKIERFEATTLLISSVGGMEKLAKEEIRRAVPDAVIRSLFLRGNLLAVCEQPLEAVLEALVDAETETVGHIFPLQVKCQIGKGKEHLQILVEASTLLPGPSPEATFRAVCQRRGVHEWTSQMAQAVVGDNVGDRTSAPPDMINPEQIVTIQVFQDLAFLGVAWTQDFLRKEVTKIRKYAPGMRPLNRAEPKLREALQGFKIHLTPEMRALDVGASPGGWTKVLAEYCAEVLAVDPGELDPRVLAMPNVVHFRERSEAVIGRPELGLFDIITNDMNMDPRDSARILCELAPVLKPGGWSVMTVKFVTRHRRKHVQAALDVLMECYTDAQVGRMAHNAREITIVCRKR